MDNSSLDRVSAWRRRRRRALLVGLCWSLAASARAQAADGEVLIFCTDSDRHYKEAKVVQGKKYHGKAEIQKDLPALGLLAELEKRAAAGKKIAAVEIIGHGNSSGPHITADGAPRNPGDRLTVETLKEWTSRLRREGKDPQGLFAPGASVTIRACYVGEGELPKALLELLPRDGKVESDAAFYKNGPLGGLGGFWGRKRVTTHDQDYVFRHGDKGDTVPWEKRSAGKGDVFVIGSWRGEATVSNVSKVGQVAVKTKMTIHAGNFVIKERTKEGKTYLELAFAGNLLIGQQEGNQAIFEPDPQRGGNTLAARLKISPEGKVLEGELMAGKGELTITRELLLTRVP